MVRSHHRPPEPDAGSTVGVLLCVLSQESPVAAVAAGRLRDMSRDPPAVSAIVCTRNRAGRVATCLDHIASAGRRFARTWELVVVDNGSTDHTASVLADWASKADFPVTVLNECRPGLSAARNKGVAAARGEILAFVDDDCHVDRHWMQAMFAAHRTDPFPDLVGGRVDLADPADAPVSIRPFDEPVDVTALDSIFGRLIGCNFSGRAEAVRAAGPFDERLGAGTRAPAGEDVDFFYRLLRRGCRLRYDPEARLLHAHGRRNPAEVAALGRGYLRGRGAFYAKHVLAGDAQMLRHWYWALRSLPGAAERFEMVAGALTRLNWR